VRSRALDLLEQEKALRKTAERIWGPHSKQMELFG